jgi:light-regulated signal transduction histidine kinase (bacteriophytochrome)
VRAQDEVKRLNAELEERVARRTAELEAANRDLDAFSRSVSHELRAPLRAVDSFSRLLHERCLDRLDSEGREYLDFVRRGALEMGRLIEDLLRLARSSRQPLEREAVDVGELVRRVRQGFETDCAARRVRWLVGELGSCRADPALLRQVWVNLISNALKYTRKREEAVIEIGARRQAAEPVYFIKDNGEGFDMRQSGRLFKTFSRLHAGAEFEGAGVGLAIVSRIVERHGGRIWADAAPGQGAEFCLTLGDEPSAA